MSWQLGQLQVHHKPCAASHSHTLCAGYRLGALRLTIQACSSCSAVLEKRATKLVRMRGKAAARVPGQQVCRRHGIWQLQLVPIARIRIGLLATQRTTLPYRTGLATGHHLPQVALIRLPTALSGGFARALARTPLHQHLRRHLVQSVSVLEHTQRRYLGNCVTVR